MSFCCADLFKLKHFKQVRLAAGERGLYRQISWPFICTTPTISQWLHGGELLFISNAGPDTDEADLLALARESFEKALSGMVLLTGGDSIPTVPPALSRLCDEAAFPLFDMPWDIKLVDITQEISEAILYRRAQSKKGQRFIEQLLFSDDDRRSFEELAGFYEVPCRPIRFVTVVDFPPDSLSPTAQERLKSDISHTFKSAGGEGYTALTMGHLNTVVCLALANDARAAGLLNRSIADAFETLCARYPHAGLRLGIGRVCGPEGSVRVSYADAGKALALLSGSSFHGNTLRYSQLGIYKLFFEIQDREEIRRYYMENLECLIEADRKNGSDLVGTLRSYLYNNCNLLRTSQAFYIHRNTLIYRLNTIRGLLGRDLDDALVRHELFNSLLAADFLNH